MKKLVSLNLTSWTCNTLEHFYPTKHEIHVLTSVRKELPCSHSRSTAKQQLTSQRKCTFVTAGLEPFVPHTI